MHVIETENLSKSYGSRAVLHYVNLRVPAGQLVGFLGPNGAGKTTTIRILMGLLHATVGRAMVLGRDCWRDGPALRKDVGYLPGEVRFYDGLTGRATLKFLAGARRADCNAEIARLQRVFELDLDKRVRNYSSGMKQKLGLMQAMMHRPKLLILDEPTNNLDPLVRQALYDELRAVTAEGRTVLFSSHTLSEVEQLCEQVAIVRDGHLVEQERVDVLRHRALRHVEILFEQRGGVPEALPDALHVLSNRDGALSGTWSGPVSPLVEWLAGQAILDVSIAPPDLEDLFLTYYSDAAREGRP